MKLTQSMSVPLGIILGMFFLLGASGAHAQTEGTQTTGTQILIPSAQASLASDVCDGSTSMCDYIDTVVTLSNNGVTPRVVSYGLVFTNIDDETVFKSMPIGSYKLYPHEVQTFTGRIAVPQPLLGGTYKVSVVATEVSTGRVFALKEASVLTFEGTMEYRVTGCTIGREPISTAVITPSEETPLETISCAVVEKVRLNPNTSPLLYAVIGKGGIESKALVSASSKAILDGKTKTEVMIPMEQIDTLTGGNYTLSVYLQNGEDGALLSQPVERTVYVDGPRANFEMLEIDKATYKAGETALVHSLTQSDGLGEGVKLNVELRDATGVCGSGEETLTKGTVLNIKVDRDCTLALLTAKIVTAQGETVAIESIDWTEPTRGIPTAPTETESFLPEILTESPITITFMILVLGFLSLIYWAFVKENIFKRGISSTPTLLILGLLFGATLFGGAHTAEASLDGSFERGFDGWNGGTCAMIDSEWSVIEGSATLSFDKATYAPGETVTATISESFTMWPTPALNFPPGSLYTLDWTVSVPGAWGGLVTSITLPPDAGTQTSGPSVYQFAAPVTPGTYTAVGSMNARSNNGWAKPTGPFNSLCATWGPVFTGTYGSATFDVVAVPPSPPVANLTVNGVHDVTVNVGDTLNYTWSASGGTSDTWGSNFTTSAACPGGPGPTPWTATNGGGTSNGNVVPAAQAGCTYTINYTVSGPGGANTDTIYVRINNLPPPPPIPVCTGSIPANSSAWDAEESSGLSVDTPWVHQDPDTASKCQYHCNAGYVWNGSSCAAVPPPPPAVCTGSIPANSSAWDAEESTGLAVSTPWSHADPDTATKCQYHCDAGYTWNGGSCVPPAPFACTGSIPANSSAWDAEESTGLSANTPWVHQDPDTAPKCQYHCDAGYTWNGSSCVVVPPPPVPAPTCSLTFNGSSNDQYNVDPMQVRTWAWSSSNGVNPFLLTANVTNCENPAFNTGGTINWQPWLAPGTGNIAGGSNTDTPGVNRYGCMATNVYRVTNSAGVSVTCDITVGFINSAGVNLTSHTLLLNSGSLTNGQTVNFRSTVQNNSSLPTPNSFSDNFTYRYGTSGVWNAMNTVAEPVLNAGASRVDTSSNLTLSQVGTLQIQHCVDSVMASPVGEVAESNENDNCQVVSFNVSAVGNQPPVVNAGPDKAIVLPTTNSAPTGASASDPDGNIASRQWTFVNGPTTPTITNGTTLTPSFTNLTVVGTYTFRLTAIDNQGASSWDQMQVTVSDPAGPPPCVLPTPSWTGVVSNAVSGNVWGTGPFTSDSLPARIARFLGGVPGTTRTVTFSNPQDYPSYLGGTNNGFTTSAYGSSWCGMTATLVGGPGNQPPTANAGPDTSITLPTSNSAPVGASASDPEGNLVSTVWTFVSGPSTPTINNGNTLTPTFTNMTIAGTYVFRLTATDGGGLNTSDNMQVVVNSGGFCVLSTPSWTGTVSSAVSGNVWGTTSFKDNSDPANIARFLGGTPGTVRTVTFSNPRVHFGYTGGTNNGFTTSAWWFPACGMDAVLEAGGGNQSPVVNAGPDKTITLPTTSSAPTGASATDPEGNVTVLWTSRSGPTSPTITNGTTLTPSFTNMTVAGTYVFRLTATDNQGATASDDMQVTVEPVGGGGGGTCPATIINNCVLQQTPYGGNSGTCEVGYGGNCNYTCQNNGSWSRNSNTCALNPTGIINANPGTVSVGNTTLITWSSNNATACTVTSNKNADTWNGRNNAVGETSSPLNSDTTYVLTCDGIPVDSVTVTVDFGPNVTATPKVVKKGSSTTLTWDTNNGDETLCTLTGGSLINWPLPGGGNPEQGSTSVVVNNRTVFTLTCPTGVDSETVFIEESEFEE